MKLAIKGTVKDKTVEFEHEIERLGQVKEYVKAFGLMNAGVENIEWTVAGDGSITSPINNG